MRQYFFGVSARIACTFTRAGLKIFALIGAPEFFPLVGTGSIGADAGGEEKVAAIQDAQCDNSTLA